MSPQLKAQTLKRHGTFLYVRKEANRDVVLYQLDGFYVEVFFDANAARQVTFRTFTDTDDLNPYLLEIDISEVEKLLQ